MEITINLSNCDIRTIQRWIMDAENVITDYMKKEESHGELTAEESRRYCEWRLLRDLLENILRSYYAQGLENADPVSDISSNLSDELGSGSVNTAGQQLNKELDFLEDLILGAHAKLDANKGSMTEEEEKEIKEQLEILYTIGKIVQAEECRMTEEDRKSLAGVTERILDGSASAHLTNEKDGQIEITVYDSICGSGAIAKLEFFKMRADLMPKAIRFY